MPQLPDHPWRRTAPFASVLVFGCSVSVRSLDDEPFDHDPSGPERPVAVDAEGNDGASRDYGRGDAPRDELTEPPVIPDGTELSGDYQSLIVTEPAVLAARGDARDEGALWSFRALMQWLSDDPDGPDRYALGFLESWESGAGAPPRPGVRSHLIDGWVDEAAARQESPASGETASDAGAAEGDAGGAYAAADEALAGQEADDSGTGATLRWADVPFRLIAIVPRVDLARDACAGPAGELRYVYAGSDWRYERDLELTLIVEVPLPVSRTPAGWARAFSSLEGLDDDTLGKRLAELTAEVARESDPLLARVRTNEVALAEPGDDAWELREFRPAIADGRLELGPSPLEFTPRGDVDESDLASHILGHASDIRLRPVRLPGELQAMVARVPEPDFRWDVPGLSAGLLDAFSVNTCNGCHGGNERALPFQHVGPASDRGWPARLSPFLHDPEAPSDELRRRAAVVGALADVDCVASEVDRSY